MDKEKKVFCGLPSGNYAKTPDDDNFLPEVSPKSFFYSSPDTLYREFFKELLSENDRFFIIVGTDSGAFIRFILNFTFPEGSKYLFVEFDDVIPLLQEDIIPEQLSEKICISNYSNWLSAAREMGIAQYIYSKNVNCYTSLAAQEGSHNIYSKLVVTMQEEIDSTVFKYEIQLQSRIFIASQLKNLQENKYPAALLRGSFKNKTAFILAGGPSLDEYLPWIKEQRHNALVIAVSRISKKLLVEDLIPDIVVCVDPQEVSFAVSKDLFNFGPNTLFAHSCSVSDLLAAQWPGHSIYLGQRYPWNTEQSPDNTQIPPSTVTNSAVQLAYETGCKSIILFGVDLCYSQSGYSHAKGSLERDIGPLTAPLQTTVKTNNNAYADTNGAYNEAIISLGQQASSYAQEDCTVINPSPNSAQIESVQHIPLNEVRIDDPLISPPVETMMNILPGDSSKERISIYRSMLEVVSGAIKDISRIEKLSKEALRCNDIFISTKDIAIKKKQKNRMDQIEKLFNSKFLHFTNTIVAYNAIEFSKALGNKDDNEWTETALHDKFKLFYKAFVSGSKDLLSLLNDSKTRVLSRIEEDSENPDIEAIITQWNKDGHYGRALVWKTLHPDKYDNLPLQHQDKFKQLETEFKQKSEEVEKKTKEHLLKYSNSEYNIGKLINKANDLFIHENIKSLARIINMLSERRDDWAKQIGMLANAFYKELDGNTEEAENLYDSISEKPYWLPKQISLERTLTLAMDRGDFDKALKDLKILSERIISYLPFYAELLHHTGDVVKSIEKYTDYITKVPTDIDAAIKLKEIFDELGNTEGAHWVLMHIKNINPSHKSIINN